jgi:hypothetical protein
MDGLWDTVSEEERRRYEMYRKRIPELANLAIKCATYRRSNDGRKS